MTYRDQKLIVGNWKMHGRLAMCRELVSGLLAAASCCRDNIVIAPPAPYLHAVGEWVKGASIALAAQDVSSFGDDGAHTGEISAEMLVDLSCRYVLIGHSERRKEAKETDALLSEKIRAAFNAGLIPIVCLGESLDARESGQALDAIGEQLNGLSVVLSNSNHFLLAYEPVWAIGTGKTPCLADIEEVHSFLKNQLAKLGCDCASISVLYGGSVKPENAEELLGSELIGGLLVGGASLDARLFEKICQAAEK